jgi:hypothetical protein
MTSSVWIALYAKLAYKDQLDSKDCCKQHNPITIPKPTYQVYEQNNSSLT